MSQILSNDKILNLEQADLLAEYLQFNEIEKEYLFILVQIERSGRQSLKKYFTENREKVKSRALDIRSFVSPDKNLTEVEKAVFYSSWLFQALRLLCSIDDFQKNNFQKVKEVLGLSRVQYEDLVDFLIRTGLCIEENDRLKMGSVSTHLESTSRHLPRHHTNWRLKAIQNLDVVDKDDLYFTAPMTMSKKDFHRLREEILALIKTVYSTINVTEAEQLVCLNLDYFVVNKEKNP